MRPKPDPEFEFHVKQRSRRGHRTIHSIGQIMVVVALSGLALAVLPDRSRLTSRPPGIRPRVVRAVQVISPGQTPSSPDRFVHKAPAGIDDAMVVTARDGIDDAMIVSPARLRGGPILPEPSPEEPGRAKVIPLTPIPSAGPQR